MTEVTRAQKVQANKGVAEHIKELLDTSPDDTIMSSMEILGEVLDTYPHADIKTVSNAVSNLHRKNYIRKHPGIKGVRGARWGPILKEIKPKPKKSMEAQFNPTELGVAVINAIQNMAKRIREQSAKIDQLLNTLSNRTAAWSTTERNLRNRVLDQNKIIESLRVQLEPDPDLMFKLSEVAEFQQLEK